jgi:hypothetical protein
MARQHPSGQGFCLLIENSVMRLSKLHANDTPVPDLEPRYRADRFGRASGGLSSVGVERGIHASRVLFALRALRNRFGQHLCACRVMIFNSCVPGLGDLWTPGWSGSTALGHAATLGALPACCRTQPGISTGGGRKRRTAHDAAARFRFGCRVLAGKHQLGGTGPAGPVPDQPAMVFLGRCSGSTIFTRDPSNPVGQHTDASNAG